MKIIDTDKLRNQTYHQIVKITGEFCRYDVLTGVSNRIYSYTDIILQSLLIVTDETDKR